MTLLAFSQSNEQLRSHKTPCVKLHGSFILNNLKLQTAWASLSRWTAGPSGSSTSWARLGNRKGGRQVGGGGNQVATGRGRTGQSELCALLRPLHSVPQRPCASLLGRPP